MQISHYFCSDITGAIRVTIAWSTIVFLVLNSFWLVGKILLLKGGMLAGSNYR